MRRLLALGVIAALTLVAITLTGCGGGDGGGVTPPPAGDTGIIAGRVAQAQDPATPVANAQVTIAATVAGVGTAAVVGTTTDAFGRFTLTGVPVGTQTLVVEKPSDPTLRSQSFPGVLVDKDATTNVAVTLLGVTQSTPTLVRLSPPSATLDLFADAQFAAVVSSSAGTLDASPSYMVTGGIGTVDIHGLFHATAIGRGRLIAICGGITAQADIEVQAPRPPDISTFILDPLEFTSSGGQLSITAAVNDGDGVRRVLAEISRPGQDSVVRPMTLEAGTAKDGTYRTSWTVPANDNRPDSHGVQAPIIYSVKVTAVDNASVSSFKFLDFTVLGLNSPPGPF